MPVRDLWMTKATKKRPARRTSKWGTNTNRWQAVWTVDGRERTRTFARKIDAERHLAVTVTSQLSGGYVDPRSGRIAVRDYGQQWLAQQLQLRSGTRRLYALHLSAHIYPAVGHLAMGDVKRSTIQGLVSGLVEKGLAPGTVRQVATTCSILFRAAVVDQVIGRSPCEGVRLPAVTASRAVALTVAQLQGLAAHMPAHYRALPLVGAQCGLRPGELLGLELDPARSLDMLGRRILVRQQLLDEGGAAYLGPPKTAAGVRTVPVDEVTLELLARHLEEFPPVDAELVDRTGARPVKRMARLVFSTSKREPVRRASFNQAWNDAVRRARAGGVNLPARVTPHSLRHTYVALLIAAGKHPKTIQAMVGHKSITETMNTYGHLMDTDAESTRAAIGAAFRQDEDERGLRSVK